MPPERNPHFRNPKRPETLHGKRRAAAAALFRLWIVEDKARLQERFLPVQRHSVQIHDALGINKNLHAVKFEYVIVRSSARHKFNLISQPGTAATDHAQAQSSSRYLLPVQSFSDLLDRFRGDVHLSRLLLSGRILVKLCQFSHFLIPPPYQDRAVRPSLWLSNA